MDASQAAKSAIKHAKECGFSVAWALSTARNSDKAWEVVVDVGTLLPRIGSVVLDESGAVVRSSFPVSAGG